MVSFRQGRKITDKAGGIVKLSEALELQNKTFADVGTSLEELREILLTSINSDARLESYNQRIKLATSEENPNILYIVYKRKLGPELDIINILNLNESALKVLGFSKYEVY